MTGSGTRNHTEGRKAPVIPYKGKDIVDLSGSMPMSTCFKRWSAARPSQPPHHLYHSVIDCATGSRLSMYSCVHVFYRQFGDPKREGRGTAQCSKRQRFRHPCQQQHKASGGGCTCTHSPIAAMGLVPGHVADEYSFAGVAVQCGHAMEVEGDNWPVLRPSRNRKWISRRRLQRPGHWQPTILPWPLYSVICSAVGVVHVLLDAVLSFQLARRLASWSTRRAKPRELAMCPRFLSTHGRF